MEIQWSLVLFSALAGAGGWMLAGLAYDDLKGKNASTRATAAIAAIVVLIIGGIASVTHLSHPDRVMGALSHPTSDIFYEALLLGLAVVCTIVYVILLKRESSDKARKVFICLAAAIGIVLSFVSGLGYAVMDARYSWNTPLLPLGYLATSIPTGLAAYLVVVLAGKDEQQSAGHLFRGVLVGGIIAAIVAALYAIVSGTAGDQPLVIWGLVVIVGGIVPACIAGLMAKNPEGAFGKAVCALLCALVGSLAFRCFMWMTSTVVANLFLQL